MAIVDNKIPNILNLTDCLYFTNGNCMFKNKCRYRHCPAAIKQLEKCPHWPDSCHNIDCPYRHTKMPSKIPESLPQRKDLVTFFWDIENVPIPKGQRPFDIVQRIRQKLVTEPGLQEADFSCYCNSNTISQENQQNLHHATVRIVHIPDRKSGAADRQIMLDLDRFERTHRPPATIVLISGDIDFVGKLSDLRHHAGFRVIVIYNKPAKEELKATVNAHYPWELFIESSQQQQLPQPIIRNNSGKSTNESANFRSVVNDRLNNYFNVNQTASQKVKQPSVTPIFDLLSENNLVQNNYLQTNSSTPHRFSSSVTRKHRSRDRTQRLKPPITQPVNQTASPKLKQPSVTPISDSLDQNNLVQNNYLQTNSSTPHRFSSSVTRKHRSRDRTQRLEPSTLDESNLVQNNYLQTNSSTPHRFSSSMTRNNRSRNRTQRLKPPIAQLANQTPASNAGNNTPPSASTPIVAPRARIRKAVSANRLYPQNISVFGSCEQIPALTNDDTAKMQRNSYSCPHCTNEFSTIKALRQHQKDKNHLFTCSECKEGFATLTGLKQHQIAKGHNDSTNIDDQCNVQLDTTDNLNMNPFVIPFEPNLNMSNNNERLPVYHSPIADYSAIDGNK